MTNERVFSGIQPTGDLHLGNYLGAIVNWVRMQETHDCIFCIVDLHAITMSHDPQLLAKQTRELAAALIASGLDPDRCILFHQSAVPMHAQLAWILQCVARVGWLDRMTQFKEKKGKDKEGASVGLYTYPVLQAADILGYRATHVPVGEDQKQHLELARDIAIRFNQNFGGGDGEFFPVPEPMIQGPATRVMSLRDGTAKMSKSDPSDMSRIAMTDDADTIMRKFKKAKTDPEPLPESEEGLEGRPEAANLVNIYAALAGTDRAAVLREFGGQGFGSFKPALGELAAEKLAPNSERYRDLKADKKTLDRILRDGAAKADAIAAPILEDAKRAVGFLKG
ncbi:tryptophan--tRNA ligase [Pacificimonas flava]|uniref:Tryptophan--tRNA ligase n=2 Tax=Pacificimonas TaxID=1960290 RepID=A0A219B1Q3_9SPHN|nr:MULTISPECIES: tryptophan--tRNA ligase [Pacificimonas]MBZ6378107.1 tryptophan--tRNA ligase [Pacificimonas aurantium]OWV32255.1 tryptophan--tRNA ligase [Pacificimonas flava]